MREVDSVAAIRTGRGAVSSKGLWLKGVVGGLLVLALLIGAGTLQAADEASAKAAAAAAAGRNMLDEQLAKIPSGEEGIKQILDAMNERLELSPDQIKDIRPVVADAVAQMEKSRDRFKAGEINPMALIMQLQLAGQKSAVLIEPVLNEKQVVEYKAMRQEQRQQMMQEMMKRNQQMQGAPGAP